MRYGWSRRGGRPLRFLGATLGGWVVLRVGLLWPTIETPRDLIHALVPPVLAAVPGPMATPPSAAQIVERNALRPLPAMMTGSPIVGPAIAPSTRRTVDPARVALAAAGYLSFGREIAVDRAGTIPPPLRPTPADPVRRLSGSIWGIAREGVGAGLPGGQLGGSQVGARLAYALGEARAVALAARVSAPLAGRGAEAGVGIEFRPAHLPLRVIAEQRIALDGGRGGAALYVVGGVAPTPVAAGFRLESYAQAGIVRGDAFADGAVRVTRGIVGGIDAGIGAWGGAQPRVARLDVGPTIGVALPVAGQRMRVSLDWRQRVAGRARPDSGPALSIGSDF